MAEQPWGTPDGCLRHNGQAPTGDNVFLLYPDRVEGWESSCAITGVDILPTGTLTLFTECSGEGETWSESYSILPPTPDGVLHVEFARAAGVSHNLELCQ